MIGGDIITNFERFKSMTMEEFAETRIRGISLEGYLMGYSNDTENSYAGTNEDFQRAIIDEIDYLKSNE